MAQSLEQLGHMGDILFTKDSIGSGAGGDVYKCMIEGDRYAVKCARKADLGGDRATRLSSEIQVLREIQKNQHPMMIELHDVVQDEGTIYIIMELLVWGDLFDYLEDHVLTEQQVAFYASNVTLMLEYLHDLRIVYRDLKAENLVLMANGYLKLIDFGFAKKMKVGEKAYSLLGTPGSIAPEIVSRCGYSYPIDWWALGVLVYDMMFRELPFGEDLSQLTTLCRQPLKHLSKDNDNENGVVVVSGDFSSFVTSLLHHDSKCRLHKGNAKSHTWFALHHINWGDVRTQRPLGGLRMPQRKRYSSTYVKRQSMKF